MPWFQWYQPTPSKSQKETDPTGQKGFNYKAAWILFEVPCCCHLGWPIVNFFGQGGYFWEVLNSNDHTSAHHHLTNCIYSGEWIVFQRNPLNKRMKNWLHCRLYLTKPRLWTSSSTRIASEQQRLVGVLADTRSQASSCTLVWMDHVFMHTCRSLMLELDKLAVWLHFGPVSLDPD